MSVKDLEKLLKANLAHEMTPQQREAQRRSFAYGTAKAANSAVTRETVDSAADASHTGS